MQTIYEPAREIPIARDTDVIVVGGGPAGLATAVAAARAGAHTTLV
jgi:thioredoxin reductase